MIFAPIVKVVPHGDKEAAKKLLGLGMKLVPILQNLSSFRGLKQNSFTRTFGGDIKITASHCFSQVKLDIWVRPTVEPIIQERISFIQPEYYFNEEFLFFAQSYEDSSCWGFDRDFKWTFIIDAPVKNKSWLFLGCAKVHDTQAVYAMSFDPFVVWELKNPSWLMKNHNWIPESAKWINYNFPICPYGEPLWATEYTNQPVWTGNLGTTANKFFIRPYISSYVYRDLLSLDMVNKTWGRQAYFQNSGSRLLHTTGEYYNTSWPTWDGEKQISWWYSLDGAPYWSWIYHTVGYYGDPMPHDGSTQSLKKPSRLLTINGDTFFCGNPDFGSAYQDYPIMQKVDEDSYMLVREGPGFHWGRECCYTGSHILARNPDDYSVWAFNELGWKQIANAPERNNEGILEPFNWFDCCYAGGTPKPFEGDIEWAE